MKKVTISKYTHAEAKNDTATFGFVRLPPEKYEVIRAEGEELEVSDGYHTFEELYDHKITLYIALCKAIKGLSDLSFEMGDNKDIVIPVWRSELHSDGSRYNGWFILGMKDLKGQQITYHLPIKEWENTNFAETFEKAPEWDGHTSQDVLNRIKDL